MNVAKYIQDAIASHNCINIKRNIGMLDKLKKKYDLSGNYCNFSSDLPTSADEFDILACVLGENKQAVYIYSKKNELTDKLEAEFSVQMRFIEELDYRVFLLLPDFHIWFYDVSNFDNLLRDGKLIFLSSPIDIVKTASLKPVADCIEDGFGYYTQEENGYIYGFSNCENGGELLINYYGNGCLDDEELDVFINNHGNPVNIYYILFIIKLAVTKKCFLGKVNNVFKKAMELIPYKTAQQDKLDNIGFVKSISE